jgi:hypothetical protein
VHVDLRSPAPRCSPADLVLELAAAIAATDQELAGVLLVAGKARPLGTAPSTTNTLTAK